MGFNFRVGLLLLTLAGLYTLSVAKSRDNYPGAIELVGFSNRRARTYYSPPEAKHKAAPAEAKMQADMETVKRNIEQYNKLLALDTKYLPESQKDMLERIVERVARLKESLDITDQDKENKNVTNILKSKENETETKDDNEEKENSTFTPTDVPTNYEEADEEDKTEPTLVLDETTLLQLQTSMDKLAAAQAAVTSQATQMKEFPATTEMMPEDNSPDESQQTTESPDSEEEYEGTTFEPSTDTTDPAETFVAARSNSKGITAASDETETMATLSTTIGSQRTLTTSGKLAKTRATKRPHNKNANNSKRRPSTSSYNKNTNKQKINSNSAVTQSSLQQYQKVSQKTQQQQQQQYQQPSSLQYGQQQQQQQVSQQQNYQSQPPKSVSPSSISLDKYNAGGSSAAPANAAASYGINPVNNIPSVSTATNSFPAVNAYGSSPSSSLSSAAPSASQDLAYDAHVNASAIIDSLNNNAREEYYQQKQSLQTGVVTKDKKPITGAKPTKYHYYPHNQHIYLLPECAIQQVCNAVYVRLNYTQPLCACPSRYRDPCSASLNEDDQHTTKLVGDGKKKAITLAKTCEATTEMRECRTPKDWSLLALQNTRTGKSHYLVICRCPDHFKMEGPMAHDQPTYASVPGIRVFGMMCVKPGYSIRKPPAQPPKRYQLQKPFYRPGSQTSFVQNNIANNKDAYVRPTYGSSSSSQNSQISSSSSNFNTATSNNYHGADSYQTQGNYQYLNRPESISSSSFNSNNNNNYRPEPVSINNFPGAGYGRNNEREGDAPIEAATEVDNKLLINTSTQAAEETNTTLSEDTTKTEEELKREKRSISENTIDFDDEVPEFPWDRVIEFEKTLVWD